MDRRSSIILTVIGVALLIGAPAWWYLSQPDDEVGDVGAITAEPSSDDEADVTSDESAGDGQPELEPEPLPLPTPSAAPLSAGELSGPLVHVPAPTRLAISSLGVDAQVVPVALEDDGSMEIPDDVDIVGWYEPGVRPGQDGTAVMSAHVDSRSQGPGVLFDLRTMDVDDRIVTSGDRGEPVEWKVVARTRYAKGELPIDDIFVWDGPPRLALITCGGDFDAATRSYEENIVVYAEPA